MSLLWHLKKIISNTCQLHSWMNHFALVPYGHQEVRAKNPASVSHHWFPLTVFPRLIKSEKGGKLLSCSSPHTNIVIFIGHSISTQAKWFVFPLVAFEIFLNFSSHSFSLFLRARSQPPNNPSLFIYVSPLWSVLLANRSSWVFFWFRHKSCVWNNRNFHKKKHAEWDLNEFNMVIRDGFAKIQTIFLTLL